MVIVYVLTFRWLTSSNARKTTWVRRAEHMVIEANLMTDPFDTFEDFVKRQLLVVKEEQSVDWEKEREEWLEHLNRLRDMIESFLRDYIDSGRVKLKYKKEEIKEENVGSYDVVIMSIIVGTKKLTLFQ